jgi:3-oxoacyl-[acyl-carrier protein] reductase
MDIRDRVAMITGTKRIGSGVAIELARSGAAVALIYRSSRAEADETAQSIRQTGGTAMVVQADVSQRSDVDAAVAQIHQELGVVDILVNAASIYASQPIDKITEADWDANLDDNLTSTFFCAMAVLAGMRTRGGGRIINFADWIAASGRPRYRGFLPYYVSKMGVIGLTQALALELAPDNILVNAIAPGPILPPSDITDGEYQEVKKATPLGRWGGAVEIAKTVKHLIETDFITGECIRVDGGRHIY